MSAEFTIIPAVTETQIELQQGAWERRAEVLASAEGIATVQDSFDAECAADALRGIAELAKGIDAAHREAKAPVLELTRRLDGLKRDFLAQLEGEKARLSRVLGAWQAEERRKAEEAARAARREEEIRMAQLETERRMRIAEESKGRTGTLQQDLAQVEEAAVQDVIAIRQDAVNAAAPVAGIKARTVVRWEIVDGAELVRARPDLVIPEPQQDTNCKAPLKTRINAALKLSKSIPGLRVWEEARASL